MGICMASSYANIFTDRLKRRMLFEVNEMPGTWWKYIGNIFAIWRHCEVRLVKFIQEVNHYHPTIKFTIKWFTVSVSFLDTRICSGEGQLMADLYVKNTDMHQYHHYNSCHPEHCEQSILFSQALRTR